MTHNVTRVLDWVVLGGREVAEEKEQLECVPRCGQLARAAVLGA